MFGWGLTIISTFVLAYVAWRAHGVPWIARLADRRTFGITAAGFWLVMVSGRLLGHNASFPAAGLLEFAGMTLTGVLLLCFLPLLAVDLATGFGAWGRRCVHHLRGWSLLGGLALAFAASVQGFREPEIVEYEVEMPGLPMERDGLVVVALSDFHLGATLGPRWLEARMDQVRSLRPDMIVFLGDLFEGHGRPDARSQEALRDLRAPLGVWGVDGNHVSSDMKVDPPNDTNIDPLVV